MHLNQLPRKMLYTIKSGSHLYGLNTPESDIDYVSVFLPRSEDLLSLQKCEYIDNSSKSSSENRRNTNEDVDDHQYALQRYLHLVLSGNPNLTEILFAPNNVVIVEDERFTFLKNNYDKLISSNVYNSFVGFSYSQRKKLEYKSKRFGQLEKSIEYLEIVFTQDQLQDSKLQLSEKVAEWLNINLNEYKGDKNNIEHFNKGLPLKTIYTKIVSEYERYGWRVHTKEFEKLGYDCHIENTEFLTSCGWKKYNEIGDNELLATINPNTKSIEYQIPYDRMSIPYEGDIYTTESQYFKCATTPNHRMFVNEAHRGAIKKYNERWIFDTVENLQKSKKSSYYVLPYFENNQEDYNVEDEYLILMGLYISDGTYLKRNGALREIRLCKTKKGKIDFFEEIIKIKDKYCIREYTYERNNNLEYTWVIKDNIKHQIAYDCGLGTKNKKFPNWIGFLSKRQANLLLHSLYCGDGSKYKNGYVYYNSNFKVLDVVHFIALLAGKLSNLRTPTFKSSSFGKTIMNQVYWTNKKVLPALVVFNSFIKKNAKLKIRGGNKYFYKGNVNCFSVNNNILITRLDGKIAITGNCKFAYHTIRLLYEGEQLLLNGKIEYPIEGQVKNDIFAIRKGEVPINDFYTLCTMYEDRCRLALEKSKLPKNPKREWANKWLINTLKTSIIEGEI